MTEFGIERGTVGTDEERVVILNFLLGEVGPVSMSGLIAVFAEKY